MSELVLWTDSEFTSPWAHVVWVVLKEKGLTFTIEAVDLARGEHKQGELPRRTLSGKIPALRHGDLWLCESWAIAEYLEEVYAPPAYPALLPRDPLARARDRELRSWLRTSLAELRRAMPYEGIFVAHPRPPLTAAAEAEIERLLAVAAARWRGRAPGEATLADFELAFQVRRPIHYGHAVPPAVREFADALWWRPSSATWVELDRPGGGPLAAV
jgi:glutathione S-transferase